MNKQHDDCLNKHGGEGAISQKEAEEGREKQQQ